MMLKCFVRESARIPVNDDIASFETLQNALQLVIDNRKVSNHIVELYPINQPRVSRLGSNQAVGSKNHLLFISSSSFEQATIVSLAKQPSSHPRLLASAPDSSPNNNKTNASKCAYEL